MSNSTPPPKEKHGRFPETDWTQLERFQGSDSDDRRNIINTITSRYWLPIYQFLVRKGLSQSDAQDLAQDFFMFAMEKELFSRADRNRGRFRTFLLAALENFVLNEWRRQSSLKRRPKEGLVSLYDVVGDGYVTPSALAHNDTPETIFHRSWLYEVVRHVLHEMETEFSRTGKSTHYQLFRARVIAPELEGITPPSLAEQAQEFGIEYKEAANQIVTAKRAFLRLLTREVRSYASSAEDLVDERLDVIRLLSL